MPPSAPRKSTANRVFYGWAVVGAVSAISFASGVETNPVLGIFQDPMTDEFGWSRALFTLPMSVGTILGGIAAIIVGPLLDRFGGRWIMTTAVLVMGFIFIGMGMMQNYGEYFVLQLLGRTVVASTFFMIIGIVIPKWFVAKRGRATGIAGLGQRLGHAAFPIMIERIIKLSGWRAATISLGLSVWVVALIPAAFVLRRRPEDLGLGPDGTMPDIRRTEHSSSPMLAHTEQESSFNLSEAIRVPSLYLLLAALSIQSFVATGINFHWFSYLTANAVPSGAVVASLAIAPLVGMPASLIAGFAVERIPPQFILASSYIATAASIVILLSADNAFLAILFGITYGAASGVQMTNNQIIWADFFGRKSIGSIRGIIAPVHMVTNALGPFAAALSFDITGGYTAIFTSGIILLFGAAALAATARKPIRPLHQH